MADSDQHQFKDRYMLRLPDGMRDRIKAAAEANNRSMNAEIVAGLEFLYPEPKRIVSELLSDISALIEDYDRLYGGKTAPLANKDLESLKEILGRLSAVHNAIND